jgi:hypothetical protein
MPQTEFWRGMQVALPNLGPAIRRQRRRSVWMPPIILLFGLLALIGGLLWTIGEYSHHRAGLQVAETSRLLEQFRSGAVASARARIGAAWQAEGARAATLPTRLAAAEGVGPARVRRDHRRFVLETIEEYGLEPDIEILCQFIVRLSTCVRAGSCDPDVVAAQLGRALWAFRDQHQPYLEASGIDLDPHLAAIVARPAATSRPDPRVQ